jgi:hypothetical protein
MRDPEARKMMLEVAYGYDRAARYVEERILLPKISDPLPGLLGQRT